MIPSSSPAVAVISSQVGRGAIGSRATTFILERLGLTVWLVPTIWLPWHPAYGGARRLVPDDGDFATTLADLAECEAAPEIATVLTGYFATPEQVEASARFVERLRLVTPGLRVLVDPIVGDGNALYVPEPVAVAVRDRLLPLADVTTPNLFEVGWLTGRSVATQAEAIAAARALGVPTVAVTSAPALMARSIATLLVTPDAAVAFEHQRIDGIPHGTGDLVAALLAAHLTRGIGPEDAVNRAVSSAFDVIARTARAGADELVLTAAQDALVRSLAQISVRRIGETAVVRRPPPRSAPAD
jgi:pyridoxine kinase